MEAYDLYSGTYVALPQPKAQPAPQESVSRMTSHDRLLAERGYEGVAAIVEGDGGYGGPSFPRFMFSTPGRESALEMRERYLELQPMMEAWYRKMREHADAVVHDSVVYGGSSRFIGFDEASELPPRDFKWRKLTYEWHTPEPLTLRERERAHIKTLNGGDQPWKRKRK